MKATNDGEGGEYGHSRFDDDNGETLRTGKIAVRGHADYGAAQKQMECKGHDDEHTKKLEVGGGNAEDIAKEIAGQIGHEAWGKIGKENAEGHAERPEHGNGGVLAHVAPTAEPLDAKTGGHGKHGSTDQGGESPIGSHPHSTEGGMGHAATGNDHTAGDDVGAYDGTEQRSEQCSD